MVENLLKVCWLVEGALKLKRIGGKRRLSPVYLDRWQVTVISQDCTEERMTGIEASFMLERVDDLVCVFRSEGSASFQGRPGGKVIKKSSVESRCVVQKTGESGFGDIQVGCQMDKDKKTAHKAELHDNRGSA